MMNDIQTDPALLETLRKVAQHRATADEVNKQRVSFIMSAVNKRGDVTEEKIREVLAVQAGA